MIYISHPTGNQNCRAVLKGLYDHHLLSLFITTIANFDDTILDRLSKISIFDDLNRRKYDAYLRPKTITYPYYEFLRLACMKLNLRHVTKHENGIFSIDNVIRSLDRRLANYIIKEYFPKMRGVYAYEDAAYHSFIAAQKIGLKKIYDLPIGYWRAAHHYLMLERDRLPDWAPTLTALKNSDIKCERKDKELELADIVLVASKFTASTLEFALLKPTNVHIIPYGFPNPNFEGKDYYTGKGRKLKLLYVGGLTQRKGIADVFFVANHFSDYVELTVVGQKTTNDCKPLNEALKKHKYISSLSNTEILDLMRTSDVLLFPSIFEGFGLVISEAMSQGLPITTNRTAGADFITHDTNGWLVHPGQTSDLINIVTYLLDNPSRIEKCGLNALKTAAAYSWCDYADRIAATVKHLIKND